MTPRAHTAERLQRGTNSIETPYRSLIDHDISDFSFYIFNINLSKNLRLFTESKLIKLFNFCNKKFLNINLSPYINTKHVTI